MDYRAELADLIRQSGREVSDVLTPGDRRWRRRIRRRWLRMRRRMRRPGRSG